MTIRQKLDAKILWSFLKSRDTVQGGNDSTDSLDDRGYEDKFALRPAFCTGQGLWTGFFLLKFVLARRLMFWRAEI
jgi:hypothetical protein